MPIIGVIASSDRNVPGAPTIGTATNVPSGRAFNNGRADVTFTAPTYTGGLPITSYTVTSSPGGFTGTGAASPISVTGLQSNTAYTFTVTATNAVGTSAASAASNSITATTVPQAPTIGTATDGGTGTTVSVAFTANATGGSAITGFTATSSPGSITGTGGSSPITVSGLTAGTAYTFTVTATNANGTSAASAASNSVTPQVPGSFESIASATPNGTATVTFSSIPSTYKNLQLRVSIAPASTNLPFFRVNSSTTGYNYIGSQAFSGNTTTAFNGLNDSRYYFLNAMFTNTTTTTIAIVDLIDYASTSKLKVMRGFAGTDDATDSTVEFKTLIWNSTAAISQIDVIGGANFSSGTTVALYGIKG